MTEIDIVYWMYDVKFGQQRGRLILELHDLMDKKYQEENWLDETPPGIQESFDAEIYFSFETLEDLNLFDYIEEQKIPYDEIGIIYKSKEEVNIILRVAKQHYGLYKYAEDFNLTNDAYLSAPQLNKLRLVSIEAFKIFMENEKDNKEFCQFIVDIIKKERSWFKIKQEQKDSYQIISDYIKYCRQALQKRRQIS